MNLLIIIMNLLNSEFIHGKDVNSDLNGILTL